MKIIYTFTLGFFFSLNLYTQQALVNTPAHNVAYRGLSQKVVVMTKGIAKSKLNFKIKGGDILSISANKDTVKFRANSDSAESIILQVLNGNNLVSETSFKLLNKPNLIAKIAGATSSNKCDANYIKKSTLISALGVSVSNEGFAVDPESAKVISFNVCMIIRGWAVERVVRGNKITPQVLAMFESAKRGSKIYIENIKAKTSKGIVRLGGIKIKVT